MGWRQLGDCCLGWFDVVFRKPGTIGFLPCKKEVDHGWVAFACYDARVHWPRVHPLVARIIGCEFYTPRLFVHVTATYERKTTFLRLLGWNPAWIPYNMAPTTVC